MDATSPIRIHHGSSFHAIYNQFLAFSIFSLFHLRIWANMFAGVQSFSCKQLCRWKGPFCQVNNHSNDQQVTCLVLSSSVQHADVPNAMPISCTNFLMYV